MERKIMFKFSVTDLSIVVPLENLCKYSSKYEEFFKQNPTISILTNDYSVSHSLLDEMLLIGLLTVIKHDGDIYQLDTDVTFSKFVEYYGLAHLVKLGQNVVKKSKHSKAISYFHYDKHPDHSVQKYDPSTMYNKIIKLQLLSQQFEEHAKSSTLEEIAQNAMRRRTSQTEYIQEKREQQEIRRKTQQNDQSRFMISQTGLIPRDAQVTEYSITPKERRPINTEYRDTRNEEVRKVLESHGIDAEDLVQGKHINVENPSELSSKLSKQMKKLKSLQAPEN